MRTAAGKEVILDEMKSGELFGELAAMDGIKRSANVTALTRGEACVMPATVFRDIVYTNRDVAERLFCVMSSRIRELNERFVEQTVLDLRHRLYSELLRLSSPRGATAERVVTPPPFHHILAARIGCRREQVTREFTMMAHEGLIERTRGALVLRQPEILRERVAEALREEA
jgi:CRP-like cAMP-binding protein